MKNTHISIIFSLIVLIGTACSQSDSDRPESYKDEKVYLGKIEIPEDEDDFPSYNLSKSGMITEADVQLDIDKKVLLEALSPIPDVGPHLRMDQKRQNDIAATYKEFLKKYKKDTVLLRHFRGRYAKKLLLDYEIIHTSDVKMLSFFINELIVSRMGKFGTIVVALKRLNKLEDPQKHEKLINQARKQLDQSLDTNKEIQERLPELMKEAKKNGYKEVETLDEDLQVAWFKDDAATKIKILERYREELFDIKKSEK